MNNLKRYLALISISGVLACQSGGGAKQEEKVFKLGAVLPLTGPAAAPGNEMNNAVLLAVDEWNSSNKLSGYKVTLDSKDDAADPKQAVSSAHALMSDSLVAAVVAHLNSGCFLPASRIYHENGVAAMSGATTNPEITQQGYPEIFRLCTTDLVQGELTVPYLKEAGYTKIAIIHDKTQYGQGLAQVVKDACPKSGIEVLSFDGINVGDKDFKAILTKIKDQTPDVIYFGGMYDEAGLIVKQMRDLGMTQQFVSDDGAFGQDTIDAGGVATEGAMFTMVGKPLTEMPQVAEFLTKYEKRFGVKVQNYGPYAYDVANILLTAISKVISRIGGVDKAAIVQELKQMEYDGVVGHTAFDEKGDTKNKVITIYRVQEGKFVPLKTMGM
ncbi:MAG: branched-chain amino acid ABC transporter substrate-binding protein [Candidatus Schekmanbacteria bacterium]|nr:branched-chain amino acid ABC transporter substrate-binding protein [Candidatus Schekmanbacteria bacterium]